MALGGPFTPTLIQASEYAVLPWVNGLGTTTQVAIHPPDAEFRDQTFLWRVSTSPVPNDGPWSKFAGYDRCFVLLEGAGVKLAHHPGKTHRTIREPHTPYWFSGDLSTHCDLIRGPIGDFNVFIDRKRARGEVKVIRPGRNRGDWIIPRSLSAPFNLFYCAKGAFEASWIGGGPIGRIDETNTLSLEGDPKQEQPVVVFSPLAEEAVMLGVRIFVL